MKRLAILGSTRGTNLLPIIKAINDGLLHATIEIVISNKRDAPILARAQEAGLTAQCIDAVGLSREAFDAKVSQALQAHQVDLIVLIGYMRILSAEFVNTWQQKIINVHPSLLPAFAGKMDIAVHEAVIAAGVTQTGCTVHFVTEQVDAGPIVVQKSCQVLSCDTPETLKQRVQSLEGEALVEAIAKL